MIVFLMSSSNRERFCFEPVPLHVVIVKACEWVESHMAKRLAS